MELAQTEAGLLLLGALFLILGVVAGRKVV